MSSTGELGSRACPPCFTVASHNGLLIPIRILSIIATYIHMYPQADKQSQWKYHIPLHRIPYILYIP